MPGFSNPVKWPVLAAVLLGSFYLLQAQTAAPDVGAGEILVHPHLGGTIFGFDVDQNGTEGLLSESAAIASGSLYASETFDQATGQIIKVLRVGISPSNGDDDVTWGVTGTSVGLVEHQHTAASGLQMTFLLVNPLSGNTFSGLWLPPGNGRAEIYGVSRNQGTPINAFQVFDLANQTMYVYGSNVAHDTFGPFIQFTSTLGVVGLNTNTSTAVLSVENGPFNQSSIAQVNLNNGSVSTFLGVGDGPAQGLAVDSTDNIACVTTFADASVAFYDLSTGEGFKETLPNCRSEICDGWDVEFDPIHKLFLVAQPVSSQSGTASTIYVYNTSGALMETLNGFDFPTQNFDVLPVHIALNPSQRSGFVDVTNSTGVGALQSFTY